MIPLVPRVGGGASGIFVRMGADVIEKVAEQPGAIIEPSDPELENGKVAHIIRKDDQMRGYVLGEEITALCGEKFIPTRDPYKYPVCEACRAALASRYDD